MTYFGFTELQNIGFGMVMWSQCGSLSVRDSTDMTVKKQKRKRKSEVLLIVKKQKTNFSAPFMPGALRWWKY